MDKKILLIEDDGYMSKTIKKDLKENGYDVKSAYSYESAVDRWKENHGDFDCLIIDLHIDPRGMDLKEVTKYNPYYGIAAFDFFKKHPYTESSKALEQKTILYSGYIGSFKQYCKNSKENYKKLTQIDKNESSSFNKLMNQIDRICHE